MNEASGFRTDEEKKYFKVIGGNDCYFKCVGTVA
jgi:hypothetical protein